MTSIFDRIGTLAERLRDRFGREYGPCRTCGKPTRSHRVGGGVQCHVCYTSGVHVVAADGGTDDVRALLEREAEAARGAIEPAELVGRVGAAIPPGVDYAEAEAIAREVLDVDEDAERVSRSDRNSVSDPAPDVSSVTSRDYDTQDDADPDPCSDAVEFTDDRCQETHESARSWSDADFTTSESGVWPPAWLEREQWMGHINKRPFAPWGDRDADLECTHSTCVEHDDDTPEDVVEGCEACQRHRSDEPTSTAECGHDARYKWGHTGHYVDGETVAMAEDDPRLDGRAFLQQADDSFVYVDGDDVLDPETREIHPVFLEILEHLGLSYADISVSVAGVHVPYRGELPEGVKQLAFAIDEEPWGANDEVPTVEIYDGKRVCVATGEHVPGTPTEIRAWDPDGLEAVLEEHVDEEDRQEASHDTDRERDELEDYEPLATGADETTDEIRDVYHAVDRLRPEDLPLRTQQVGTDGTGWEQWDPSTYRASAGGDSLHRPADETVFYDHKHGHAFGVLGLFAAEQGIIGKPWYNLSGEAWWRAVEAARDAGAPIPEYDPPEDDAGELMSQLPLARLQALEPDETRRYLRRRGIEWPTTHEARDRLQEAILEAMDAGEDVVLDAPTALGKTYTVATMLWRDRPEADDSPVIHFHETKEARDQALEESREAGVGAAVLRGRKEVCPVAAGAHDPSENPDQVVTIDGVPASEWFDAVCDGAGVPFSVAKRWATEHNDQGLEHLPCCEPVDARGENFHPCPSETQWDGIPRQERLDYGQCSEIASSTGERCQNDAVDATGKCHHHGGERDPDETNRAPGADVIHATHQFAFVPSLVADCNVIFDEQPDFRQELGQDRVRRAVTAFLQEVDAEVRTFEGLVEISKHGLRPNEHDPRDFEERWVDLLEAIDTDPPREWYFENPDAHTLAPALARAILAAEERPNGRRAPENPVPHHPPRFDADASEAEAWNRVWVTVVLDEDNTVRRVRAKPDLGAARSVIGLDARPAMPLWQQNTAPWIQREAVLEPEERRLWRLLERGLMVVQVGDAVRPAGRNGQYLTNDDGTRADDRTRAVVAHLREEFGRDFSTAITASKAEQPLEDTMHELGVVPETMHFGEEKSRNDFAGERVGLVNGCIDPGDDYVLDLLAEAGLEAEIRTVSCQSCDGEADGCEECDGTGRRRAKGTDRGFSGPDAEAAAAVLASVRENHGVQSAGRYARDPDDPEDRAMVFVRTAALPPGFADLQVPGVEWVSRELQREIIAELQERPEATTREIADAVDASKEHVRRTLQRLEESDAVRRRRGAGEHGADVYRLLAGESVEFGLVDLSEETANTPVWESYTWALAIARPDPSANRLIGPSEPSIVDRDDGQAGLEAYAGGEPPPDEAD